MKNTTLSRKPGNDMKKGVGLVQPRARANQSGDGEDFAFNGQMGDGVNRAKNPYAHNQWSGHSNDGRTVNYGSGPRVGNASSSATHETAHPATHDKLQLTVATASGKKPVEGPFTHMHFDDPDKINVGSK